jgi:outer membrane lipoprotein-sorting protein
MRRCTREGLVMKRYLTIAFFAAIVTAAYSQDAMTILNRIDANEVYSSIRYDGQMIIEYSGKRYVKTFTSAAKGNNDTYIEFTNPEDLGTKYLKKEGRLYVYSPDTEEVMLISGHLLKESMMGSDLSYEDTVDNEKLSARFTPVLTSTETLDGRSAYVLDLTAKKKTESYPKQRMWVDTETYSVLKFELYALSGALLKDYKLITSKLIGSRYYPTEFEMRDLLRKGSRTIFKMTNVQMDTVLPDSLFSLRNLEK